MMEKDEAAALCREVHEALVAAGWADIRINRALDALAADDEELRRDAERYRWLCDGRGYFLEERGLCGHGPDKEAADAAIDEEWDTYMEPGYSRIRT